jgi:hypothetical protein
MGHGTPCRRLQWPVEPSDIAILEPRIVLTKHSERKIGFIRTNGLFRVQRFSNRT